MYVLLWSHNSAVLCQLTMTTLKWDPTLARDIGVLSRATSSQDIFTALHRVPVLKGTALNWVRALESTAQIRYHEYSTVP